MGMLAAYWVALLGLQPPAVGDEPIESYRFWQTIAESVQASVENRFGRPFREFDTVTYDRFIGDLELHTETDLMTWSIVTGIPVIAVTRNSNFFYFNMHLVAGGAADDWPYETYSKIRGRYDTTLGRITLTQPDGTALATVPIGSESIRSLTRDGPFTYHEGFALDRIDYELLAPYLASIEAVPHRREIARGLRSLPLSIVRALRGKAIFLSLENGRSYSISQPVGNTSYCLFAGLQPGVFLEATSRERTALTLVHELGHIVDHCVITGHYSRLLFPLQFPGFQTREPEKRRLFGHRDDPVSNTPHGYISTYARSNAQEDFAEHFMAFLLRRDALQTRAAAERREGATTLQEKHDFMRRLIERTDPESVPLTPAFIAAQREAIERPG